MQTTEEIRKIEANKLLEDVRTLKAELDKIEFELRTGQEKANHKRDHHRKQIARIKTIIKEKELSTNNATDEV